MSDKVAGYVEGSVLVQPLFAENDDSMLWGFGADAGIERFFTESWALRIGVGYNYLNIADDSMQAVGARWALAAYF
jgi:opacity protein-like surface antigen